MNLQSRKIYLVWRAGQHKGRLVIGELSETPEKRYVFRYRDGSSDLKEALTLGFAGYPAFPLKGEEFTENIIETFSMRLPPRSRSDFHDFLKRWEIQNQNISDFDLLSITGGKLVTDHFEFIDPHAHKRPNQFITELAGITHTLKDGNVVEQLKKLKGGKEVSLRRNPDNRFDPDAVEVYYSNNHVGHIKRIHATTISNELKANIPVKAFIKDIDANGVINSVLLKVSIG